MQQSIPSQHQRNKNYQILNSPSGNTPSQKSGHVLYIPLNERKMNQLLKWIHQLITHVQYVLKHLCGALLIMSTSQLHNRGSISRCLLRFHKDKTMVSYHSATYEEVISTVKFEQFPKRNTKNLIALEDLGRGATGKAWLCATLSIPFCSACVLKFHNNSKKIDLEREKHFWHLIYPEFKNKVRIEHWSGQNALVMPHFTEVLEENRHLYKNAFFDTLTSKFISNGLFHGDEKWKNIGIYREDGVDIVVVFDLHSVEHLVVDRDEWFENVEKSLF
jgi:hypothetical protein